MIVSVSRRCDIPRFRFDWFMERLEEGFADVVNPFNSGQVRRVPLLAGEAVLVFWTRDPRNILDQAGQLEEMGFPFYIMVTVTGYPALLEPNMPPAAEVCAAMGALAEKLGERRVIWRYDPVFLSSVTGADFHRRNFTALAEMLEGRIRRVIISLYDPYKAAERRLKALEQEGRCTAYSAFDGDGRLLPQVRELLGDLAGTAAGAGMEIQACAEAEDLAPLGIGRGACIDGELIRSLWGITVGGKDKNQRPWCGCAPSVDIGRYGPCPARCVYCYARR